MRELIKMTRMSGTWTLFMYGGISQRGPSLQKVLVKALQSRFIVSCRTHVPLSTWVVKPYVV